MKSTEELLRKAVLTTGTDFGNAGQASLSIEQVKEFITLMQANQDMLPDVRTVQSNSNKWTEPIISFAGRIARPGVTATRLAASDRVKPVTAQVEISTVLLRGEVPVADEVFEDNVAGESLDNTLETLTADQFGYDIEELFINGDKSNMSDAFLGQLDGWLVRSIAKGHAIDGSTYGKDYQAIFKALLQEIPQRFLRNLETNGRFYTATRVVQEWRDILSARGTALGDMALTSKNELRYQGILIKGVSNFPTAGNTTNVLFAHAQNLYAGYNRRMTFEGYRDPREGVKSLIVTARVDAEIAVPEAVAIATDVDCSV